MLNNNAILNLNALTLLALKIICFLWIDNFIAKYQWNSL